MWCTPGCTWEIRPFPRRWDHTFSTRSYVTSHTHKSNIPGDGVVITEEVPIKAVGFTVGSNHVTFPLIRKYNESILKMHTLHQVSVLEQSCSHLKSSDVHVVNTMLLAGFIRTSTSWPLKILERFHTTRNVCKFKEWSDVCYDNFCKFNECPHTGSSGSVSGSGSGSGLTRNNTWSDIFSFYQSCRYLASYVNKQRSK